MELMNPTLTVQNAEGLWLVTMEHQLSDVERIDFTIKMPKQDQLIGQLQKDACVRVARLLESMASRL